MTLRDSLKKRKSWLPSIILFVLIFLIGIYLHHTKPPFPVPENDSADIGLESPPLVTDTFMRAKVLSLEREEEITDFGRPLFRQTIRVRMENGEEKGEERSVQYEMSDKKHALKSGSRVVVNKNVTPDDITYYVSDVYRLNNLWLLLILFAALSAIFGRGKGIMAFLGLGFSLFVIYMFILPHIIAGSNPFFVCLVGAILIACVSLYLAHGVNRQTTIALAATLMSILIALGLSEFFVSFTKLFGLGTEEAFYLQYAPIPNISLQGLLLGGIIIGTLGILDDITTAQTAAVAEIHRANESLSVRELYRRGTAVGREHIASLVNTLVLAYTGAAFPLLLLFSIYEKPIWVTLNSELVMEEIIRTLVGSTTLILAVPITTFLAAIFIRRKKNQK